MTRPGDSGRTGRALAGLAAGALLATVLAPSCALDTNAHDEPDGFEGYDLTDGFFAEPPPIDRPMGLCKPTAEKTVYFESQVQPVLERLGCTEAMICHGAGASGLTLAAGEAMANFMMATAEDRLIPCDAQATLLQQPRDDYHKTNADDPASQPDFQVLIDWVLSCAPYSAQKPEAGCGGTGGTPDGGSDAGSDVAPPPCNTTGLTYTTAIDPLVTAKCVGCHTASPPPLVASNPAANYASLGSSVGITTRGYLYSTSHRGGTVITKGSCEDQQVQAWIDAGARQ